MLTEPRRKKLSAIQTNLTEPIFPNHGILDIIVSLKVIPEIIPILIEILVGYFLIVPMVVVQYVE